MSLTFGIILGATAETQVGGPIAIDTTWTLDKSPYIVVQNIEVAEGVTLTIESGVTVKFEDFALIISGTLIARGTKEKMIKFTSNQDSPEPGDWKYIKLADSSVDATFNDAGNYINGSILEYCTMEYAGNESDVVVLCDYSSPFINYCTIKNNKGDGIKVFLNDKDSMIISNNTITGSIGGWRWSSRYGTIPIGTGISILGGSAKIKKNEIYKNSCCGIYVSSATATINASIIGDNKASGVYSSNSSLTITNSTINNNLAVHQDRHRGGGIYAAKSALIVDRSLIKDNHADHGGGIYVNDTSLTITASTISSNSTEDGISSGHGGGIYVNTSLVVTIDNNIIIDNSSSKRGGGIYIMGPAEIKNNIISYNSTEYGGGGIYASPYVSPYSGAMGSLTITNNSIGNNSVSEQGGGIYGGGTFGFGVTLYVNHNVIGGNTDGIYLYDVNAKSTINNNNIYNNERYEVTNVTTSDIDAKNNWWGTINQMKINQKIYDFFDDEKYGKVLYNPFLISLNTDAPVLDNQPPIASFIYSPEDPVVNQEITFDASKSYDPDGDIVSYDWDFGDGSAENGKSATHSYSSAGSYTITLKVTDNEGATTAVSKRITVSPDRWPDIKLSANNHHFGIVPVGVNNDWNLTISNVGDAVLTVDRVTSNDPTAFTIPSPQFPREVSSGVKLNVTVRFSPTELKLYSGTLTIASNDPDTPEIPVSVEGIGKPGNQSPIASFTYSPGPPAVNQEITFDASSSHDPDGQIDSYKWNLGDGSVGSGKIVTHSYYSAGSYTVMLSVTDNEGTTATVSKQITVEEVEEPDIQLSANSHSFGDVQVGTHADWNLAISNIGDGVLKVDRVTSNDPAFTITSSEFPWQIPSSGRLNVTVRFLPTEGKLYSGTLTIVSNDPDEPEVHVSVEGTGTDVPLTIGDNVKVTNTADAGLRIHKGDPAGETVKVVPDGWVFKITSGPQYNIEGHNWWEIQEEKYEPSLVEGWVAEDFLEEVSPDGLVPSSPPAYFISAQKRVEQAVNWAEGKEGNEDWKNLCLRFVSQAYGLGENTNSKTTKWKFPNDAISKLGHKFYSAESSWNPPRGALIFFSGQGSKDGVNYEKCGHIGIYLGNGKVVHAYGTVRIQNLTGSRGVEKLSYIGFYIGWAYPPAEWLLRKKQPPVASFTYSPGNPVVNQEITFDASGSIDADGDIVSYDWDFGDGSGGNEEVVKYSYSSSGSYNVTLKVTDNKDATNTVSKQITVAESTDRLPEIELSANSHNFVIIPVGVNTDWNLTISNIGDAILRVNNVTSNNPAFTISSPKFPQEVPSNGKLDVTVRFSPTEKKSYSGILTITSNDPNKPEIPVSVEGATPENQPPVASFTYSPGSPVANREITFDASSSHDPDGKINSYEWDLGDAFGNGEILTHSYSSSGSYNVTLKVTDNKDATNTVSKQITVVESTDRWPEIKLSANNHSFSAVPVQTHTDWSLSISNIGDTALTVISVISNNPAFTIPSPRFVIPLPKFPQNVSPGDDINVTVRFSPTEEKLYSGILTIASNDPDELEIPISVEGTGITQEPYISNIDPTSGAPGIPVTISGMNLVAVIQGVYFGGYSATIEDWSDKKIIVKVPYGKGTVDVRVSGPIAHSNSVPFTYNDPFIDRIEPVSGRPDEEVKIIGRNFGYKNLHPTFWVKFGKSLASTTSWTDTEIVAKAPSDCGTGIEDQEMMIQLISYATLGWAGLIEEAIKQIIENILIGLLDSAVRIPPGEGKIEVDVRVRTPTEEESNAKVFTYDVGEIILSNLLSPGELRVYDLHGRVTGLVNGQVKEEIPNSYCDNETILIVYPSDSYDSYRYEVVGTGEGTYGLSIVSAKDGKTAAFTAHDISTVSGAIHKYTIDWDNLNQGKKGVTLLKDFDGDGTPDDKIKTDATLQPPKAEAGGPYSGNAGSPIIFDASNSFDPDGNIVLYEWIFEGDRRYDFNSVSPTKTLIWSGAYEGKVSLRVTDDDGLISIDTAEVIVNQIPRQTTLLQNYPNPFNPETWIPFELSNGANIVIRIYDIKGQLMRKLDLGYREAGIYRSKDRAAYWDGKNELGEKVVRGIYLYTMETGEFTVTRKMLMAIPWYEFLSMIMLANP